MIDVFIYHEDMGDKSFAQPFGKVSFPEVGTMLRIIENFGVEPFGDQLRATGEFVVGLDGSPGHFLVTITKLYKEAISEHQGNVTA